MYVSVSVAIGGIRICDSVQLSVYVCMAYDMGCTYMYVYTREVLCSEGSSAHARVRDNVFWVGL